MTRTVVIVGGGIAGTTCLEALIQDYTPERPQYSSIVLISASRLLKRVVNYSVKGRSIEAFDVSQVDANDLTDSHQVPAGLEVKFVQGDVRHVDIEHKNVLLVCEETERPQEVHFDILTICTGSCPRMLTVPGEDNEEVRTRIITIRDTTSIADLTAKLSTCRRIAIVGNGGISLELINKIAGCEKIWILRNDHIGDPFLDSEASKFILSSLQHPDLTHQNIKQTRQYSATKPTNQKKIGPALGPDWLQGHNLIGGAQSNEKMEIIYQQEVVELSSLTQGKKRWPLSLRLTNGRQIDCDLVVSAIGVMPKVPTVLNGHLHLSDTDGGILIDDQMRTSVSDIYAAGDVVSCENWHTNNLWFQMRLWTQARRMGSYCGRCIAAHISESDPQIYFNFDCFTHDTKFFGKRVVLLGRYNVQNLSDKEAANIEILLRTKLGNDYVKLVIKENRIIGAILVGDSGLEETIENLISDNLNIEEIKNELLDDTIDLEDYFD